MPSTRLPYLIAIPTLLLAAACSDGIDPIATKPTADVMQQADLPVFPGAQGFGTLTPAGRGGAVIRVTNLNNSGPGSLRDALLATGPRVVVFEIAGVIQLSTPITVVSPYLTVAGQTAPAPGVTLRGSPLRVATHDVLVQHIRSRPGEGPRFSPKNARRPGGEGAGLQCGGGPRLRRVGSR
jgi:hypothetical protein